MKELFDKVSFRCSKITTTHYSTSFSMGIRFLAARFHAPVYGIYGFVRFADEIMDSFHDYNKKTLLHKFRTDTDDAIEMRISLNPILNSFQQVVWKCGIDKELIRIFLDSMEMDLHQHCYTRALYDRYILGSAETVGLMCLKIFCEGDNELYEALKGPAMRLGAAFQKINFLRDMKADNEELGRTYFPGVDLKRFSLADKWAIEAEITEDMNEALAGIRQLPLSSRKGVYLAYTYYRVLFNKLKSLPPQEVMETRVRVHNGQKIGLMFQTLLRHQFNLL